MEIFHISCDKGTRNLFDMNASPQAACISGKSLMPVPLHVLFIAVEHWKINRQYVLITSVMTYIILTNQIR